MCIPVLQPQQPLQNIATHIKPHIKEEQQNLLQDTEATIRHIISRNISRDSATFDLPKISYSLSLKKQGARHKRIKFSDKELPGRVHPSINLETNGQSISPNKRKASSGRNLPRLSVPKQMKSVLMRRTMTAMTLGISRARNKNKIPIKLVAKVQASRGQAASTQEHHMVSQSKPGIKRDQGSTETPLVFRFHNYQRGCRGNCHWAPGI
jgi:hypothetical protein